MKVRKIYGRLIEIRAKKTGVHRCDKECKAHGHLYKHSFKPGATVYGLENGDILISTRRLK